MTRILTSHLRESAGHKLLRSRSRLPVKLPAQPARTEAEGGCGVIGVAANIPIAGQHVLAASCQMHNRGNGKGGGIAMAGLDPVQAGVDRATLKTHYLLQIALLDPVAQKEIERDFVFPFFEVAQGYAVGHLPDHREVQGLELRPPDIHRYFVRVKPGVLEKFAVENDLEKSPPRAVEDEFVYQNSFRLNHIFYASLGEKRAFVLSHGRDLAVFKIVGYAEDLAAYYRLDDCRASVWIAHQRYPTKGRVWHPGGAHPFVGLNEALVHNGDLANYYAICEYLRQRNIAPLFLTDTEVAVLLFDLYDRIHGYPLEVTLEALAPTTEYDFTQLPRDKQDLYRVIQRAHLHASPDGPWFFILARSLPDRGTVELLAVTDTSMLRPQVFALYDNPAKSGQGPVQIGVVASERQAINACLRSLTKTDQRFQPLADHYWVARGGSYTDGGAFRFMVTEQDGLLCTNKFGRPVNLANGKHHRPAAGLDPGASGEAGQLTSQKRIVETFENQSALQLYHECAQGVGAWSWSELESRLDRLLDSSRSADGRWQSAWQTLTLLRDRHYPTGEKRRASIIAMLDQALGRLFQEVPLLTAKKSPAIQTIRRLDWDTRQGLRPPALGESTLALDTLFFQAEGKDSAASWMAAAYHLGWNHLIAFNWRGGRFAACGFGPGTADLRVDLYGDVGDYAASGLDGVQVYLHGDGQDQLGQIVKSGKLVVYGDVGQTFLYGAKGGDIFVRGSTAGRPLINAVGRPRVVINGVCLDYLAESFMAGDPLQGGGFVILNGIALDEEGCVEALPTPYPGGNLFSMASGGAVYIRDPQGRVSEDQLNGGAFWDITADDWVLIEPYLQENERLFGIRVEDLLKVDGKTLPPQKIFRKICLGASQVYRELSNR
jgi:glutamate synthase domain-containing protein 1